ncbi:hypothetical protein LSPH24S_01028 [Lysinibacillus sphaericus]
MLERLRTNFKEDSYAGKIEIYMIDPFLPGSGEVWRTNQSKTLLMNTVASQITLFTDFSVECERFSYYASFIVCMNGLSL